MILDSNVIISLIQKPDSRIGTWIYANRSRGLHINPVIFAEIAPNFEMCMQVQDFLVSLEIEIEPLTLVECHRAGHAFAEYRRRKGTRTTILPDFFIGAQASVRGWPLVTRDRKGFASYFPDLMIIDPMEPEK